MKTFKWALMWCGINLACGLIFKFWMFGFDAACWLFALGVAVLLDDNFKFKLPIERRDPRGKIYDAILSLPSFYRHLGY